MRPFYPQSVVRQLAEHLREEIRSGGVDGSMPGVAQLVRRLGVGTKTVVEAMEMLKREGWLEAGGERRRSRIRATEGGKKNGLQVRILLYEESDAHTPLIVQLGHSLEQRGHQLSHASKTLRGLGFDVKRVERMVRKEDADAWVVQAGSRVVLEWFAGRSVPAFALFGSQYGLPMASVATLKSPAVAEALGKLVELGHRRIVMMSRAEGRVPAIGLFQQRFLESLERLGIPTSRYNLPDWEDTAQGFHHCLDELFRVTPPTALYLSESSLFFAAQQYLLHKGLAVPRDISLVAADEHPAFEWFQPTVSHIRDDSQRWVPRMVQWVDNVAHGVEDRRETLIRSEFVEGGTIGPAKNR